MKKNSFSVSQESQRNSQFWRLVNDNSIVEISEKSSYEKKKEKKKTREATMIFVWCSKDARRKTTKKNFYFKNFSFCHLTFLNFFLKQSLKLLQTYNKKTVCCCCGHVSNKNKLERITCSLFFILKQFSSKTKIEPW